MCQNCVNSGVLSQETYDKIEQFLKVHPSAEWGPAHIVLSDDNILDAHIKWCLGLAKAALSKNPNDLFDLPGDIDMMNRHDWYSEDNPSSLQATVAFLEELLQIPEDVR
jgi:hypothetical protein